MARRGIAYPNLFLRSGAWAAGTALLASLGGCYSHHTADEALTDNAIVSPVAVADAGVHDGATVSAAPQCAGTDAISQLLCSFAAPGTSAATSPTTTSPAADPLTGLLQSAGGLGNIASVLGSVLGTAPAGTGATTAPSNPLLSLINLAGGLGNIATLLNGLGGTGTGTGSNLGGTGRGTAMQPSLTDLLNAFAQTGTLEPNANAAAANPAVAALPSLPELLAGLGIPTTGNAPQLTTTPNSNQCSSASDPQTQFLCMLQASFANTQAR